MTDEEIGAGLLYAIQSGMMVDGYHTVDPKTQKQEQADVGIILTMSRYDPETDMTHGFQISFSWDEIRQANNSDFIQQKVDFGFARFELETQHPTLN